MDFFRKLGDQVEATWTKADYDNRAFPEIAEDALTRACPSNFVTHEEIAYWVLSDQFRAVRPPKESPFGQPDIALYVSPSNRFYIEALFWLSATTSVHQHAFSGAFHVLAGSSIHARYEFTSERIVNERFQIG